MRKILRERIYPEIARCHTVAASDGKARNKANPEMAKLSDGTISGEKAAKVCFYPEMAKFVCVTWSPKWGAQIPNVLSRKWALTSGSLQPNRRHLGVSLQSLTGMD